jgi:hypothetical protein
LRFFARFGAVIVTTGRFLDFSKVSGARPYWCCPWTHGKLEADSVDAFYNETGEIEPKKEDVMSLGTILIILLILALIGVLPTWGYSNSWGYGPGGIVGLLVIIIILALLGRL